MNPTSGTPGGAVALGVTCVTELLGRGPERSQSPADVSHVQACYD